MFRLRDISKTLFLDTTADLCNFVMQCFGHDSSDAMSQHPIKLFTIIFKHKRVHFVIQSFTCQTVLSLEQINNNTLEVILNSVEI